MALTASSSALAETVPLPVRISYAGDTSCGTSGDFREAIRRRAPELEDAREQEPARRFAITVTVLPGGGVRGTAEISDPSGGRATRQLEGNDCAEVREALAFVVAELARAVRLEPDQPAHDEPSGRSPEVLPLPPVRTRTPTLPAPAPSVAPRERDGRFRLRWELGTGLEAVRGPLPRWAPAPLGFLEADWVDDRAHVLASWRVSALRAKSGAIHGTIGDADMLWESLRAETCLPRLTNGALWATPCATMDLGRLSAQASRAFRSRGRDSVWLAPGISARAAFAVFRLLMLEADAGASLPLVRPRFYFGAPGDDETVHAVPSLAFRVGLSLGVLFR